MKNRDNIYKDKREEVGDFQFNEKTVSVFPDMIERSVPGYKTLVSLIGTIAAKYAKKNTKIYDLGCSLGATSFAISDNIPNFNGHLIAVDKSEAMISTLKQNIDKYDTTVKIIPVTSDISDIEINNASFIAMNLTLQFIPIEERERVVKNIFDGMNDGSAFVLSEKITFEYQQEEITIHELLHNFKKCRGYSNIEIYQKKKSLENVLISETFEQHETRLKKAGFSEVFQWFQGFNFISLIGIK